MTALKRAHPAPLVVVPSLRAASPAFAALEDKKAQLADQKRRLEREADELHSGLHDKRPDGGRSGRVAKLVDDVETDVVQPATRLQTIAREVADLSAAIAEVDRRLRVERLAASAVIAEGVRAEYAAAVASLARALIAAHHAQRRVVGIVDSLNSKDIAWVSHLPPMSASRILGEINDNQSSLARFIGEAADLDFIPHAEVPAFNA